ncbi:MAG TPA: secondary thiamine-phosphate synthase enzyme YjbQ [Bacteroidota bacterium]|nr:secondary thiamine-phosphate synthase enzyme YjbQ [Bacteroidota bacterium]
MEVVTERFKISTNGDSEIVDITDRISSLLETHGFQEGSATVFVPGSTASITTTEFEPGLSKDIPEALERLAPRSIRYHHDETWHDGNGHAHVRAAVVGPSTTIPFSGGELLLGTWQQIVLIDFDNRPRTREVVVQLTGRK